MERRELLFDIPSWVPKLLVALFAGSLVYGHYVRQSIFEPLVWWLSAVELTAFVVTVYLFYRFVVAVEEIAEKL
jgi:hypothetical protein